MKLQDMIAILKKLNEDYGPQTLVTKGFHNPHSYRGNFADLAFEPCHNVTLGEMLLTCCTSLGRTFEGWKGGDYKMDGNVDVYIASRGSEGGAVTAFITTHRVLNSEVVHSIEMTVEHEYDY